MRRMRVLCAEPLCLTRVLTAGPFPVRCSEHEQKKEEDGA